MNARAYAAQLRRRLLGQGFTVQPTCPRCRLERDPGDFLTSGACRYCQSGVTRDAAMQAELRPDGTPNVAPPAMTWDDDDQRDYEEEI